MAYRNQKELEDFMSDTEKSLRKQLETVIAERDEARQKVAELTAALNVGARERRSPFVTVDDESGGETTYERGTPDWV